MNKLTGINLWRAMSAAAALFCLLVPTVAAIRHASGSLLFVSAACICTGAIPIALSELAWRIDDRKKSLIVASSAIMVATLFVFPASYWILACSASLFVPKDFEAVFYFGIAVSALWVRLIEVVCAANALMCTAYWFAERRILSRTFWIASLGAMILGLWIVVFGFWVVSR